MLIKDDEEIVKINAYIALVLMCYEFKQLNIIVYYYSGKKLYKLNRTLNRHRWASQEY